LLRSPRLAVSDGSLRSLRCSLEAAVFVEPDEMTASEGFPIAVRFVGFSCRSAARTSLRGE
jgi:hypothetical protein